ncbi:unnamed protein product [Gulo gulo]|uniref:Uncharacterized protein n=1 Tax=Gulo gulo TaxID=48420 RepID=A0A9X9M3Z8_GULGU|nr:unnamed protein product [Gulo gulo]
MLTCSPWPFRSPPSYNFKNKRTPEWPPPPARQHEQRLERNFFLHFPPEGSSESHRRGQRRQKANSAVRQASSQSCVASAGLGMEGAGGHFP